MFQATLSVINRNVYSTSDCSGRVASSHGTLAAASNRTRANQRRGFLKALRSMASASFQERDQAARHHYQHDDQQRKRDEVLQRRREIERRYDAEGLDQREQQCAKRHA